MTEIVYAPIGIVHSPYKEPQGTPVQPAADNNTEAVIEVFPEYVRGLCDLEFFSHLYILFHMHLSGKKGLMVTPFLDTRQHGVFATRSPGRPNPIGLSVVSLLRIENNKLYVRNIDMLDGSPVLDIKPYVGPFDIIKDTKNGWLDEVIHKMHDIKDDGRFKC